MNEVDYILCPKVRETVAVEQNCLNCEYWSEEFMYCSYPADGRSPVAVKKGGRFTMRPPGPAVILGEIRSANGPDGQESVPEREESVAVSRAAAEVPDPETDLPAQREELPGVAGEDEVGLALDAVEAAIESGEQGPDSMLDLAELAAEQNQNTEQDDLSVTGGPCSNDFADPAQQDPLYRDPMQDPFDQIVPW